MNLRDFRWASLGLNILLIGTFKTEVFSFSLTKTCVSCLIGNSSKNNCKIVLSSTRTQDLEDSKTTKHTTTENDWLNSLDPQIYGGSFIRRLIELDKYKKQHGHCIVPKRYERNPTLGNWVNKSRQQYRKFQSGEKSSMTPERIAILNEMGFVWVAAGSNSATHISRNDQLWLDNFQKLQKYHLINGTHVPSNTTLGAWTQRQRKEYQKLDRGEKSSLTHARIELMESINFDWSPWQTQWDSRVQELLQYKKEFGDCLVPVQYAANPKLGGWVSTQRKYYKLYKNGKPSGINQERIQQLTDLGFVWNCWEYESKRWDLM